MNFKGEPFIETVSGKHVHPLDPIPSEIDIDDIAHALAMKCRFTGHTSEFYSVAQHSVIIAKFCLRVDAFAGLMHDAAEAYLPDIAGPIKPHIAGFKEIEDRLLRCIFLKYGIGWPYSSNVKYVDEVMLVTEGYNFMTHPESWGIKFPPYNITISAWDPKTAREKFLETFHVLYKNGRE